MIDFDGIDGFDDQVTALETSLQNASSLTAAFNGELSRMGATVDALGTDVSALSSGFSRGVKGAIDGLVDGSSTLGDALRGLRQTMLETVYNAAVTPVTNHVGGLLSEAVGGLLNGLLPFADGAAFTQGRVMPFANGGIVSGATPFPMRGGVGLMGEAGPEAIMPLSRGADGRLGVRTQGGNRPINVTMNVSTPDVAGFERSRGQIAAQVSRAISSGNRYS